MFLFCGLPDEGKGKQWIEDVQLTGTALDPDPIIFPLYGYKPSFHIHYTNFQTRIIP
jgi:hypothetical protein